MDARAAGLINEWLAMHRGDVERTACYMAYSVRIGGIKACRELIYDALVNADIADYEAVDAARAVA